MVSKYAGGDTVEGLLCWTQEATSTLVNYSPHRTLRPKLAAANGRPAGDIKAERSPSNDFPVLAQFVLQARRTKG